MKNFYLTIFTSLILVLNVAAQNFKTIYANETSHFSNHIPYVAGATTTFYTISIDSSAIKPTGNEVYNFVSLHPYQTWTCDTASRSTWIAQKIFQDNNGAEYFLNQLNDTEFIL